MEPPAVGRLLGTAFGRQFTSDIVSMVLLTMVASSISKS